MAISGIGVAAVSVGALLIYAGLNKTNPLVALKEIASGSPRAVDTTSSSTASTSLSGGSGSSSDSGSSKGSGGLSGLAAVAYDKYGDETYSQAKRGQSGYSDCSSFVSKAMRSYVPKFPLMVTGGFLFSPDWVTVGEKNARAGDVAVNGAHMVIVGGRDSKGNLIGVGQQRPGRDVQVDTIKNLMTGTGSYLVRRYRKLNLSVAPGGK
jgi:hypothetical protein